MGQGDITVWTNWIREETETVMNQLEEEQDARGDPDDPFNGSANGVFCPFNGSANGDFCPLQDNLVLPLPVQTPRRRENSSKHSKSC